MFDIVAFVFKQIMVNNVKKKCFKLLYFVSFKKALNAKISGLFCHFINELHLNTFYEVLQIFCCLVYIAFINRDINDRFYFSMMPTFAQNPHSPSSLNLIALGNVHNLNLMSMEHIA